ncbi:hypothetical protein [Planomicrobium sp. MB-3u-38]|uniref:hypothetical protein n=1 Tax=Planomicrobium sp. MB-3u-38 TaxID=2058318 RepID=UPI000C7D9A5C|nr:hypothetical protein [Planomicrobium sp. MB-3u-38]PKH12222.1 hypothetical protein CXF70_01585 [Planomicrobium sp. MB-3u-38]
MKTIRIILIIILLAGVIYWLWTGSERFLPYVMLAASALAFLTTWEEFAKSWKSVDGYLALVTSLIFGAYGISLLIR